MGILGTIVEDSPVAKVENGTTLVELGVNHLAPGGVSIIGLLQELDIGVVVKVGNHTLDDLIIAYIGAAGRELGLEGNSNVKNHLCNILPTTGIALITILHAAILVGVVEVGSSGSLLVAQHVVEGVRAITIRRVTQAFHDVSKCDGNATGIAVLSVIGGEVLVVGSKLMPVGTLTILVQEHGSYTIGIHRQ